MTERLPAIAGRFFLGMNLNVIGSHLFGHMSPSRKEAASYAESIPQITFTYGRGDSKEHTL